MKNKRLVDGAAGYKLSHSSTTNQSPFVETDGLLTYQEACTTPEFFACSSFVITLFGQRVVVDHFVMMFPDPKTLTNYADALVEFGAELGEG